MSKLLIIDDEPNLLFSLEAGLSSDTLQMATARSAGHGLALVETLRPDVAIIDVRLPDMSGLDLFDRIREIDPLLPVIVITAYAATETAIEAMKRGAFEYLLKPVDLHVLRDIVGRALDLRRMQSVPTALEGEEAGEGVDQIIGQCPAMQEVYKAIGRVARQPVNVLLLGESGTGKELVARAIYQHGDRAARPFLAINCAAIPETLLESELFGHEKGAFTGADRKRIGKFEQADGGTLFLDEIGDMAHSVQAKVLRLLQEQQFERIGGSETIKTDVRVIAATNQDLESQVQAGVFRKDLLYRLNGYAISLPPLRERQGDVPLLAAHYVRRLASGAGSGGLRVAPEAMAMLERHAWPGNVRELQNVIRFAMIQATGDVLTPDCLPASVRGEHAPAASGAGGGLPDVLALVRSYLAQTTPDVYRRILADVDRAVLGEVLRHVNGNQVQASELLGISRTTLRAKLQALEEGTNSSG